MRQLIITLAVLATTACSFPVDRKPAEDGVQTFHQLLDAGQLDAISAATGGGLKEEDKRANFLALLASVHTRLGTTKSSSEKGWNVQYGMSSAVLTLDYATTYAAGAATEHFVYKMKGDSALLIGYRIESAVLGG